MKQIYPSLKFTLYHTTPEHKLDEDKCDCKKKDSILFLDTLLSIKDARIEKKIYTEKKLIGTNTFSP